MSSQLDRTDRRRDEQEQVDVVAVDDSTEQRAEYVVSTAVGDAVLAESSGEPTLGVARDVTTSAEYSSSSETEVGVATTAPGGTYDGYYPADSTVTIWVGAYEDGDPPVGLPDESLDVTIERPDGETDVETVQTDENGQASVSYDLSESGRDDGQYTVEVEHADGATGFDSFTAGLVVESTTRRGTALFPGEEATFAFLARNGESPASGVELELAALKDGETIEETTETTDDDGFATITFTPPEAGSYTIEARQDGEFLASEFETAAEITCGNDLSFRYAIAGESSTYGGYLKTADGPLANTEFDLQFIESSSDDTLFDETVTTNERGFFTVEYELSEDTETGFSVDVEAKKDGAEIPITSDSIVVEEPPEDDPGDDPDPVDFSASTEEFARAPGETAVISIDATDDGDPIANEEVTLFLRYGFDGPPVYSDTVLTDGDGTAEVAVSLPETAPDGESLEGSAVLEYDDEQYTSSVRMDIERYDIPSPFPNLPVGEETTIEYEVTEIDTGDPAAGVPQQIDGQYNNAFSGSFATIGLETDGDGTDDEQFDVPADVQFRESGNWFDRYSSNFISAIWRPDHPGTLSATEPIVAGEEVEFEFNVPDSQNLYGIVFVRTNNPRHSFGAELAGEETVSIEFPSYLDENDSFQVYCWAIGDDGTMYADRSFESVDEGGDIEEPAVAIDAEPETVPVSGELTLTVSGELVDQVTMEKLWTDWGGDNLVEEDPDGGTGESAIPDAGTYEVTWDETQDTASPSITIDLPDRYAGGEYRLTAVGTDGSDTDSDTTTFTIE